MNILTYLFQDYSANRGSVKSQIVLFSFRTVQLVERHKFLKLVFCWHLILYHLFIEWHLGIELPRKVTAGKGLVIYNGMALVVNQNVTIGQNCILRNGVTIGHKKLPDGTYSKCPQLGNNVDVGANACIIGDITIGNNVVIGAGSVVVKNVVDNSIVAGNPAMITSNEPV